MVVLEGCPVVAGRFKGIAKRIIEPKSSKINKDEVLVAEFTSPEYTLLMLDCGAILTERGGILSHTAILARELNKISVVGIKGLMNNIKDGDVIKIDGNKIKVYK